MYKKLTKIHLMNTNLCVIGLFYPAITVDDAFKVGRSGMSDGTYINVNYQEQGDKKTHRCVNHCGDKDTTYAKKGLHHRFREQ